jgi:hypothetical protein
VIVPGGGLDPDGRPPAWVRARLDRAAALQYDGYIITQSAGTPHKPPPLDEGGFPILEAVAAADYLVAGGVDPRTILPETSSYDTIGNAFFSRVVHAEPRRLRRLVVVTSQFHLDRTTLAYRWIYGVDQPATGFELDFEATADVGIGPEVLAARVARERQSVAALRSTSATLTTLEAVHRWLFTEHGAYAVGHDVGGPLDAALATY